MPALEHKHTHAHAHTHTHQLIHPHTLHVHAPVVKVHGRGEGVVGVHDGAEASCKKGHTASLILIFQSIWVPGCSPVCVCVCVYICVCSHTCVN